MVKEHEDGSVSFDSADDMFQYFKDERAARPWYQKIWEDVFYHPVRRTSGDLRYRYGPGAIRNVYQRARYGYGYRDLWNFNDYIVRLIGRASGDLANVAHGWPQSDEFPTFESYVTFLRELESDLTQYKVSSVQHFGGYKSEDYEKHLEFDEKRLARAQAAMERFAKNWRGMWD